MTAPRRVVLERTVRKTEVILDRVSASVALDYFNAALGNASPWRIVSAEPPFPDQKEPQS